MENFPEAILFSLNNERLKLICAKRATFAISKTKRVQYDVFNIPHHIWFGSRSTKMVMEHFPEAILFLLNNANKTWSNVQYRHDRPTACMSDNDIDLYHYVRYRLCPWCTHKSWSHANNDSCAYCLNYNDNLHCSSRS